MPRIGPKPEDRAGLLKVDGRHGPEPCACNPDRPDSYEHRCRRVREVKGIVREITGRQRGRLYSYHRYLAILNEGTEPLPQ